MVRTRKDTQGWSVAEATLPSAPASVIEDGLDVAPAAAISGEPSTATQVLDLEHFTLGPKGLLVKGNPTFDEWSGVGELLRIFEQGIQWLIGDWLCYGEGAWGDKTAQAVDATNWSYSTVRAYKWVAERVPPTNRMPDLDFSHHMAVAEMTPSEQRKWLERAKKGTDGQRWSVADLKKEIKRKQLADAGQSDVLFLVVVQCETEEQQQQVARQLDNLARRYTLKTESRTH